MMSAAERTRAWIMLALFFLVSAGLSEGVRSGHKVYVEASRPVQSVDPRDATGDRSALKGTAFQTLIPSLLGVREVLASLMWVRADDYFHRGEYRPIIQMVKQITAIDPNQIDVYATGAWHMAYNFMDKRLIADGVKFLEEGSRNNDTVYDLYFELGYMHYDKTKDFPKAVLAYQTAAERGTTIPGRKAPPSYVRHQLAHAMEKMGDIDKSRAQWERNIRLAQELQSQGEQNFGAAGLNIDAAQNNFYMTDRRMNERLAAGAERSKNQAEALRLWEANVKLAQDLLKLHPRHGNYTKDLQKAEAEVARLRAGRLRPMDPADIRIVFNVARVGPKKIEVAGTCNVLDLSRVHVRIQDKDYDERIKKGFDFKMRYCTLEYDNVSVRQGQFRKTFELDKDPADMERDAADIYPLKASDYEVSVSYNPRLQAVFIQDSYGWSGEGITTEKSALVEDDKRAGILRGRRFPLRLVSKSITITRDDIVGNGKKQIYPVGKSVAPKPVPFKPPPADPQAAPIKPLPVPPPPAPAGHSVNDGHGH